MVGLLGLVLPQMRLASSFLHWRQMEVEVEAALASLTEAFLASALESVLTRLNVEDSSGRTGLAMRDLRLKLLVRVKGLMSSRDTKDSSSASSS